MVTVVSKIVTDILFEGNEFQLPMQNRAARRLNFHYRKRSVGMLEDNLRHRFSLEVQLVSITDTDVIPKTN